MAKQQSSQKQPTAPQAAVTAPIPFLQPRAFAETSTAITKDASQPDLQAQIDQALTFGHSLGRINTRPLSHLPIQPKLTIGKVGDPYEQEADRVAAQVVQQINQPAAAASENASVQRQGVEKKDAVQRKPDIQRRSDVGGMAASGNLESSINQARGGGQGLSDSIRQPMEQAFGADFSGVRVHTGAEADQLSRSIQASAFTTKQDVFFRQGAYQPDTRGGQELLAHELTHVVQQNGGQIQRASEVRQTTSSKANINLQNPPALQKDDESEQLGQSPKPVDPRVYQEIISWLRGKAQRQNKENLFDFFMLESPQVREKMINNVLGDLLTIKRMSAVQKSKPYILMEFNNDIKMYFKKFSIKGDALDWDTFADETRKAGGAGKLESSLAATAMDAVGIGAAMDSDLQTEDRLVGAASFSNLGGGLLMSGASALGAGFAKSAATGTGALTAGIDAGVGGYKAYRNTQRANQARDLQHGAEDKDIGLAARGHKRNQMLEGTANAASAAKATATLAVTLAGLASTAVLSIPIVTAAGLVIVGGTLIYKHFKKKTNQAKFADQLFGIEGIKDTKAREDKRQQLLEANGYNSAASLYEDFCVGMGKHLYQKGVIERNSEAEQMITSLGLKIDRHKSPATPSDEKIAKKLVG